MNFDWNVYIYDYDNRVGNLDIQAQSRVKSNKFFPVFLENNKKKVFKPLSKTKPLCTPYFAYSEVFWSTITNHYFDSKTPIYKLAICNKIEEEMENKYPYGTIVDSLNLPNNVIVNLYEVFKNHPDSMVDIAKYINFCEFFYDYTNIFQSKLMKENEQLARELAMQVLLSILKLDQNYHYENPLFYKQNGEIKMMAPMIDHEFSTMFLYLDNPFLNKDRFDKAISSLITDSSILSRNLEFIVSNYPNTSLEFLEKLKSFRTDFKNSNFLLENHSYLTPFNSSNFMIGYERYKNHNEEAAKKLEEEILQYAPDITSVSDIIYQEVLLSSKTLEEEIGKKLIKSK